MAGAPGFEPGNAGIKTPCLTAWLRPNNLSTAPAPHTGRAIARRAPGVLGPYGPRPFGASVATRRCCLARLRRARLEPGNAGIKTPCLTAWLRPNNLSTAPAPHTGRAIARRAPGVLGPYGPRPFGASVATRRCCLARLRRARLEPGNAGIKTPCLTAWLRPNNLSTAPAPHTGRAIARRAPGVLGPYGPRPFGASVATRRCCLARLRRARLEPGNAGIKTPCLTADAHCTSHVLALSDRFLQPIQQWRAIAATGYESIAPGRQRAPRVLRFGCCIERGKHAPAGAGHPGVAVS